MTGCTIEKVTVEEKSSNNILVIFFYIYKVVNFSSVNNLKFATFCIYTYSLNQSFYLASLSVFLTF